MLKQLRESQKKYGEYITAVEEILKQLRSNITMLQTLESEYLSDKYDKHAEMSHYNAELCKTIRRYSEFDLNVIGPILADIASIFEGRKYIFFAIKSNTGCAFLEPESNEGRWEERIILKFRMNLESEEQKYRLKFYVISSSGDDVYPEIIFRNCDYLQEYIDKAIQYKSDNEVDTISQDELEDLKWDYLVDSMPKIKMKHQTIFDEEEQRIQAIIADRDNRSKQFKETESMIASGMYVKEQKK